MNTGHDPLDTQPDDKAEAEAEAKKVLQQKREEDDIRWLMGHRQGRRIVDRFLDKAGVFRISFRPNSEMAFLEGQRNMGLWLLSQILAQCPDKFVQLLGEQKKDE